MTPPIRVTHGGTPSADELAAVLIALSTRTNEPTAYEQWRRQRQRVLQQQRRH